MALIDIDVLIRYMLGNEKAYKTVENFGSFFISVVTYLDYSSGIYYHFETQNLKSILFYS